jgi:hypothetical protein
MYYEACRKGRVKRGNYETHSSVGRLRTGAKTQRKTTDAGHMTTLRLLPVEADWCASPGQARLSLVRSGISGYYAAVCSTKQRLLITVKMTCSGDNIRSEVSPFGLKA